MTAKISKLRSYLSLALLFGVNLLNYMDRYTVAGVLADIQKFYDINDAWAGFLQTVFIFSFMVLAPVFGFLGDRYSRKWIIVIGMSIWIAAVFASSFVPSNMFWLFVMLRAVVGVGESSYATLSSTLIWDIFGPESRQFMLMIFCFAIPVGSGVGYGISSYAATMFGFWGWGLRVSTFFGVILLFLIILYLREPERGRTEIGDDVALRVSKTSFVEDVKALCKIPTLVFSTIGYTEAVFAIGVLSWWGAVTLQHGGAAKQGFNSTADLPSSEKDWIVMKFGGVLILSGFIGVSLGSTLAQMITRGKLCFKYCKASSGNLIVCGIGSALAVPFVYLSFHFALINDSISWVFVFLAMTSLCLNFATNTAVLLDIVIPTRRNTASAMQILISHLLGDASGPYIIGMLSDWIRGDDHSAAGHYHSLIQAFYLLIVILVISTIFFAISAKSYSKDREASLEELRKAQQVK